MTKRHLSDDRLVELCFTETPSAQEQQHLGACPQCEQRRVATARLLDEVGQASVEDADAAFPAGRLARQQVRIQQRIEEETRPARVIAFPAAPAPSTTPLVRTTRPVTRWIAAAAVAGLVVGLVAGRAGQSRQPSGTFASNQVTRGAAGVPTLRAVTAPLSDDEFLGAIEAAVEGRGGDALRPLDELTPRAADVR